MAKHLLTIHAHWKDSEDHITVYADGEQVPASVIYKIIDALADHNTSVDN
jgi:hypothetical protein